MKYREVLQEVLNDWSFEDKRWIQKANIKKGALRKQLKIKKGQDIPEERLAKAAKSKNDTLRRRAQLAATFKKMAAKRKERGNADGV